jgi:hypothetical protein
VSDTRFTLIGIGLIFAGFLILGIFGESYFDATIQAEEFEDCYEYFDDRPPVPVECEAQLQDKTMFSGLVIGLIGVGIFALVKGVKGKWDQDIKPEDMVGPGGPSHLSSDDSNPSSEKKD